MSDREVADAGTSTGVDPQLSALLCYTAWWVSGLVFLIIEQQHRGVRFHAAQSLVLFGGLSVLIAVLAVFTFGMMLVSASAVQAAWLLANVVWIGAVALWLVLMVRTLRGETWRVPYASTLAARLV